MDQLAPAIQWIKKNVFWLGCGFLSIAMIAIWFVASGALAKDTKKHTANVKKNITMAQGILNVKPEDIEEGGAHPNKISEEGMKKELSETIDSIVEAWKIRKQAQEEILVWPKVIPNDKFVEFFGQYNPPETFPDHFPAVRFQAMLELYRAKIPEQMVYLCGDEILRTRWKYDPANMEQMPMGQDEEDEDEGAFGGRGGGGGFGGFGGPGGPGGGMANMMSPVDYNKYAVQWSEKNQDLWWAKMQDFQGRNGNQFPNPTPLQCYMLQQDLWLLEAMFRIVRQVNGDSNANDLSTIKTIDHVVFGAEVGGKLGELTAPDQRLAGKGAAGGGAKMMGGMPGGFGDDEEDEDDYEDDDQDYGAMFGGRGKGMGGAPGDGFGDGSVGGGSLVPYHNRYVDVNFEPLAADVVKQVITGTELPDANLELIVAKRVPVRIALKMDERKIGEFMAACANSPFAFEIQQVRWNRHTSGGDEITLGGSSGGPASGRDKLGGMGNDLGMGDFGAVADLETEATEVRTSYDVNVEFYGIVKIYNPVREDELRRAAGLTDDEVDSGEAASIAQPAASGNASQP